MVSHTHAVASKGWFIAIVSTNVETDSPEKEIEMGLQGGWDSATTKYQMLNSNHILGKHSRQ